MSEWIDLSHPLDKNLEIYKEGGYSDPSFKMNSWCSITERGFSVFQLSLGTQTGTHIDAPSHFISGAKNLDDLNPALSIGPYFFLNILEFTKNPLIIEHYNNEKIIFLQNKTQTSMTLSQLNEVLNLMAPILVINSSLPIKNEEPMKAHKSLHEKGKYLIENLSSKADEVTGHGELMAIPLPLKGASGSPVRVLLRQFSPESEKRE